MSVRLLLASGVLAGVFTWPSPGAGQAPSPTFERVATVPLGLSGFTDLAEDPATGRLFLAFREGLRVVDVDAERVTGHLSHLETTGAIAVGSNISRIFAEIGHDAIGLIDMTTLQLNRRIPVSSPGDLVYEPTTRSLFVFSEREPRVLVLDGQTGDALDVIELPGREGRAALLTPGALYVTSRPRDDLYVIDTAKRTLQRAPSSSAFEFPPVRFGIVADGTGRKLFALGRCKLVAVDASTGERLASLEQICAAGLMYDVSTDLVIVRVADANRNGSTLISYRLDGHELVQVSEQSLSWDTASPIWQTSRGFVTGESWRLAGSSDPPDRRYGLVIWRRQPGSH